MSLYTQGDLLYASGPTTLAGTSTVNLKSSLALNNVENTALSTWSGSTNITTLGTITSGTWNGSTLTVSNGGTGATTFGQGWIYSNGGNGALSASTSPTVAYITATSTTASTFLYASTTALSATTICLTGDICKTSWETEGGVEFPFTTMDFGSVNSNATSTLIGFNSGIYSLASSTIGNGTQTSGLTISGGATTTGNAYFAGNVGIGTTSSIATIAASSTSANALAVFDQRGTGGLLTLQSGGVDKFVVANNGGLTIKGLDNSSSTVKTTSADFAKGTVGSSLVNSNGSLEMSDGTVPNSYTGTIDTNGASLSARINSGAMAIARADGKFLILRGGGTTGMDIYDPVTNTFSNSPQVLNGNLGGGGIAFPRPGGRYRVIHGNGLTTTSLIDPQGHATVAASVGITAVATGTVAFKRPDGRYIFSNGGTAVTTQIYDPVADTFTAGPSMTTGTTGQGSLVIPMASSTTGYGALFIIGGASAATQQYISSNGSVNGVNAGGSFVVGPVLPTNCEINGAGSVAIRRPQGDYLILSKANVSVLYDPVLNAFSTCRNTGPGTALGNGAHAIPLQNGTFLIIIGGGSTESYIYNPNSDTFTLHDTSLTAVNVGALSFMKPDGTWQILVGNSATTNTYDTGLPMTGIATRYTTEDIYNPALNQASTLKWLADIQGQMVGNPNASSSIQFFVRTATYGSDCTTALDAATDKEILNSGDLIRPASTDNCIRITVNFNRPMPKRVIDERGVFYGNSSTIVPLDYMQPSLFEVAVDNSAFLRRNSFDFNIANADIDAPQNNSSGPILTRAETLADRIYLPNGKGSLSSMTGTTGYYPGSFASSSPALPQGGAGTSTMVIARPNKTFVIIATLATPAANASLYDPSTGTTTIQSGSSIPTAANGIGGFALKRPDGKFLVVLGNFTATTNIYDPISNTFTVGPSLSGNAGLGASAILNTDGTYTIVHGASSVQVAQTTSSIYDPVRNTIGTMQAGPTLTTGANCGFAAIPLKNGMYKILPGRADGTTGSATTMNYNPTSKQFTAGTALTTTLAGCGASVFQRQDGFWQIIAGATTGGGAQTSTNLINPYSGVSSIGAPFTTSPAGKGNLVIPRADGTYLVLMGSSTVATNIVIPNGTAPAASAVAGLAEVGQTAVGPVTTYQIGPGSVAFQRPDGKYVIIAGGGSSATMVYDAGWYSDGNYISEQIQIPALGANATLGWKQSSDKYVSMEIKVANSQSELATTSFVTIDKPSSSIYNAGGETWAQIMINFRRDFPSWSGTMTDVYNSSAGMVYPYRNISVPTVFSYYLNNGQDLLTLQNNNSNILRVTSDGNIYSSENGGFYSGGADLAENYTSTDELEPGDVVMIDPNTPHGVLKTPSNYQGVTLGVVSTAPGFVAGAYTKNAYPIGLIGRVPVKVSTENGKIKIGDYLTVSSVSGYAMKATLAGHVIGKALESLDENNLKICPDDNSDSNRRCGVVMMFVNLIDYNGISVNSAIEDWANSTTTDKTDILSFLTDLKSKRENIQSPISEIFTDRISVVSQVISPEIISNIVNSKSINGIDIKSNNIDTNSLSISSNGDDTKGYIMKVIDGNIVIKLDNKNASTTEDIGTTTQKNANILSIDSNGNAIFAGGIKADSIMANSIVGLDIISKHFSEISDEMLSNFASSTQEIMLQSLASSTENNSLIVRGLISSSTELYSKVLTIQASTTLLSSMFDISNNSITINSPVNITNGLTVNKIGSNKDIVELLSDVQFFGRPYFTTDTAGFAIVGAGSKKVQVVFDREYLEQPIINASISLNDSDTNDTDADNIFNNDIRFIITNKSTKGFTITLNKNVKNDIQFSWIALAVKNAKTASSSVDTNNIVNPNNTQKVISDIPVPTLLNPVKTIENSSTSTEVVLPKTSSTTPIVETVEINNNQSTTTDIVIPIKPVETIVPISESTNNSNSNSNDSNSTENSGNTNSNSNTQTTVENQTPSQDQSIPTETVSVPAVVEGQNNN